MKKKIIACGILASCAMLGASAKVLSPEEAFARAMADKPMKAFASSVSQPEVSYTEMANGEAAAYVITNDYGFCVVAADDCSEALLGYSDTKFDATNIPDNMRYWLGEYARQIAWARDNGITSAPAKRPEETRQPISPILTTTWDQGNPYNSECPEWEPGTHCITGCVATAMAQVMKVHNWPDVGEGAMSYYAANIGNKKLTIRFNQINFDWDNMLDHYRNGYNEDQRKAVAILNKACGYSVEMDYTSGACGAQSWRVASALPRFFKYDKGIRYLLRDFWNLQEWEDLIYNELKEGRVAYYSGANSSAGHAFVCDGYDKNGYFHINWGWNGASNGYFLLCGLDPSQQGLGGSDAGYNSWQEIIINIKPRGEVESAPDIWFGGYDFNLDKSEYALGEVAMVDDYYYNYSVYSAKEVAFGLKFTPKAGGEPVVSISDQYISVASRYGFNGGAVIPTTLADGEYTVKPVWGTPDGTLKECRIAIYAPQSYTMTVANGKATVVKDASAGISIEDFVHNRVYVGGRLHATAKLVNNGTTDFYKQIKVSVRTLDGKEVLAGDPILVDVMAGSYENIEYLSDLHSTVAEFDTNAKHKLYFADGDGNVVTEGEEIDLYPVTATKIDFETPYVIDGTTTSVNPSNVHIGCKIKCVDGFFGDNITLAIYAARGSRTCATAKSSVVFLDVDDEYTVDLKCRIPENMWGAKDFRARIECSDDNKSEFLKFSVGESGIESVEADAPVSVEYYNLQGMRISEDSAKGSVVIVVTTFADGTQVKEKTLVK